MDEEFTHENSTKNFRGTVESSVFFRANRRVRKKHLPLSAFCRACFLFSGIVTHRRIIVYRKFAEAVSQNCGSPTRNLKWTPLCCPTGPALILFQCSLIESGHRNRRTMRYVALPASSNAPLRPPACKCPHSLPLARQCCSY